MRKLATALNLFFVLIMLSACSTDSNSTETTSPAPDSATCKKIRPSLTEKLVSSSKSDQIDGWQLMLDYPSCFPTGNLDLARRELEILINLK